MTTVTSIIHQWWTFRTTRTLPGDKLSDWGRRSLVREETKDPMATTSELQSSTVEAVGPPRRTETYAPIQQFYLVAAEGLTDQEKHNSITTS